MSDNKEVILGFTIGEGKPNFLNLKRSGQSKNTFIVGATGSGKSVVVRNYIKQGAQLGFNVIIIDPKKDPDFAPWYPNIPPYISQSSNPDVLGELLQLSNDKIDLLIAMKIQEGMSWESIIHLLGRAEDTDDEEIRKKFHLTHRDRRNAGAIKYKLEGLVKKMKTMTLSKDLENIPQISVMKLSGLPINIKQIIARSTAEYILENKTDTLLIIDEFREISPEGEASAANEMMIRYAGEGRSRGDFLVVTSRSITSIEDQVRESLLQWTLGKATDFTKVERVKKQISLIGLPLKLEDVARLGTGEFYVCDLNNVTVEKIFAWADWVKEEDAIAVARGEKKFEDLPPQPDAPAKIPGIDLFAKPRNETEDWSDIHNETIRLKRRYEEAISA